MTQLTDHTRTCPHCPALIVEMPGENGAEDSQAFEPLPFTPEGCKRARRYLSTKQILPDPGLTGWEIVGMANDLMEEAHS